MSRKLDDILIDSGIINAEQLKKATLYANQNNVSLGDATIKLGFATEEQITIALSKHFSVPYASKENNILIPEKEQNLQDVVNEKFARENMVLPLFLEEGVLAIAMYDPSNVFLVDNVKMMTGYDIQPFIASKSQILTAIDVFYGGKDLIEEVVVGNAAVKEEEGDDIEVISVEGKLDLDTLKGSGSHYIKLVNAILKQAISERTSDIHLEMFDEMVSLRFRIDGALYERTPPPKESVAAIISRIKILSKLDIAEKRLPQDGSFAIKYQNRTIEVRVSVCPTVFGEKLVLRILDKGTSVLTIERLGFEPRQREDFLSAANLPHGLIFLTGPTGSGKSTTLNAVLSTIKTTELNFMTLEDPVEYKLQGISQVQVKPQIGLTFAAGLRSFLRQDPDVILVGEVRDNETAESCLKAALTGHLVLSTLHTNEALGAIPRLIDMGMEAFLLSSSLALVAAQRLIRKLCPHCRRPFTPSPELVEQALRESKLPPGDKDTWTFYQKVGCPKCSETGYLGRMAIYEVFKINEEMRNIIYKTQDLIDLNRAAERSGAWNLRASGWRKAVKGLTTHEEILSVTTLEE
ncbi:Type II secretion system subunit [Elusimicrobium minutum Pei191]|uniref:Type II secretion system subunit n=1 Tax=Elusimicrobium minutum (strain Pei191) TaxID=445932 RepID=B2KC07_ELUMP|nr:ATPase, T2SS/T4P/T4SS family [Elusimicrobium minutum]ACC98134.1 Type II secretion system subunit [Elusimicrobium minutum Pei191]